LVASQSWPSIRYRSQSWTNWKTRWSFSLSRILKRTWLISRVSTSR
jgi:hypothetical protein